MNVESKSFNNGLTKYEVIRLEDGETLTIFAPSGTETHTRNEKDHKYMSLRVWNNMIELSYTDADDVNVKKIFSSGILWTIK